MRHGTFHGLLRATAIGLMLALFAGPALAEQIILYDHRDFDGQSLSLNQSTPNLGNFDNEASSVRVISGTWVLYRNANYGETPSRPSLTLGPGDYPNLDDVGFPRNKLSSVELLAGGAPPPQPQACTASNSVTTAAGGCRGCAPGSVAGPDNNRCVCGPGRPVLGLRGNGDDRCGPPGGQADQGDEQQAFCPGSDQISYRQGCLTCPENTVPNASNSRCVCAPGMINRGIDSRGQDFCILPSGPTDQSGSRGGGSGAGTQTVRVLAGDAWFVAHNTFGFSWRVHHAGNGLTLCQVLWNNRGDRRVIELDSIRGATIGTDMLCEIVMFSGDLDPAWTLSFSPPREIDGSCAGASVTQLPPGDSRGPGFLASFAGTPGGPGCNMYIDTVTFTGPASGKWEEAFD